MSSAYWVIFVDLFGSIWIPSISLERLIALLKISTPITSKILVSGQPCLTPLLRLKCLVAKPLFKTQLDMLLYKTVIQIDNAPDRICLHIGTNDFKSKVPNDIANAIVDLAKTIQSTCRAEVILSELTTHEDAHKESVKSVNKLLIKHSKQHHWSLVPHSNITKKVLNRGGYI